jgi:hypothetical protein
MNTRPLLKLVCLLCLLPSLGIAAPDGPRAVPTANPADAQYDIQIQEGVLLVAPMKGHVDVNALYGPGDLYGVPPTVGNVVKYLQAINSNLNIVMSPGAADLTIGDLKFHSLDMNGLVNAIFIASGGVVRGSAMPGKDNWAFTTSEHERKPKSEVEVFNLTGYIGMLGNLDKDGLRKKLDEIQALIVDTLDSMSHNQDGSSDYAHPDFRYHPGTGLLVVIGTAQAIEVSRKIIYALPGEVRPGTPDLLDVPRPSNDK